jgi:hypothetical protein
MRTDTIIFSDCIRCAGEIKEFLTTKDTENHEDNNK